MKKFLFVMIYFLLALSLNCNSQDIKEVIRFANALASQGNYSMALNEYQRAFFFGQGSEKRYSGCKMADCYFLMKDYSMARAYYDSAIYYSNHMDDRIHCELQKILCHMMQDNFGYALLKLNQLEPEKNPGQKRKTNLYQGICLFGLEQYDSSFQYLVNSIPEKDVQRITQVTALYETRRTLKKPNPSVAMLMSIMVPGTGQFYAGDFENGLNSLLLLGGLVYLGTSGIIFNPAIIVPFYFKYYVGGILKAKQAAEKRQMEKQYQFYSELLNILIQ